MDDNRYVNSNTAFVLIESNGKTSAPGVFLSRSIARLSLGGDIFTT
ncbi:unnamed protein product [Chondrus crispus]|uniref:Uncharacterized protein n=1 Tax=Chondrus crispus TaxID=2769 RepID=R7Q321_CHOCR|nr:unnamed protein product [Chondrus crispus]CDF32947.1 unnamed protein product [Chondrus crispus]|eukprot:XP_005712750.1 unnamed protein product [Chondrus crispus]